MMNTSCIAVCDILDIISSLSPCPKSHTPALHFAVYSTTINTNVHMVAEQCVGGTAEQCVGGTYGGYR